jgi:hypothetical protein
VVVVDRACPGFASVEKSVQLNLGTDNTDNAVDVPVEIFMLRGSKTRAKDAVAEQPGKDLNSENH